MAPSSKKNKGKAKPKKSHQRKQTHQKLIPNTTNAKDQEQPQKLPAKGRTHKRTRIKELVFDPEARRDYLRGFSDRKRQRRAYGLAMQQLKDRKARLENRKDLKEAELERIEEAERLKQQIIKNAAAARGIKADDDEDDVKEKTKESKTPDAAKDDSKSQNDNDEGANNNPKKRKITTTYHDESIQQQWGGDVVVTTSLALPDSDDSEEEEEDGSKPKAPYKKRPKQHKSRDEQQEFAGNVEKYLLKLKKEMPNKKKNAKQQRGGKHGAAGMQGIGNAKEMKIAQKALARSSSSAKSKAPSGGGKSSGKKGRKGGKR